jgi:hypothetical protein
VRDPAHAAPLTGSFIGFPQDHLDMRVEVAVSLSGNDGTMTDVRMGASEAA